MSTNSPPIEGVLFGLSLTQKELQRYKDANQKLVEQLAEVHSWWVVANQRKQYVEAENRRLREVLSLFVDDDRCEYDHHGYCQVHGLSKPCRVAEAIKILNGASNE